MMWGIEWLCIIRNYRAMEDMGSLICRLSDECNGIRVSESNQPMWFGMALRILPKTPIDLILKKCVKEQRMMEMHDYYLYKSCGLFVCFECSYYWGKALLWNVNCCGEKECWVPTVWMGFVLSSAIQGVYGSVIDIVGVEVDHRDWMWYIFVLFVLRLLWFLL